MQTPLHLAAREGYPQCIQILLDHGASMDLENKQMDTAESLVKGKVKCEEVFQRAVAKYRIPQRTEEQKKRVESKYATTQIGKN